MRYGHVGPSSAERLAKIRLKVERAKYHIDQLEQLVEQFRASDPYPLIVEDDERTRNRTIVLGAVKPIPVEVALCFGDVIQCLRSSLDHLMFRLVSVNDNSPKRQCAFPIYKTTELYRAMDVRKVEGAHVDAISLIASLQPEVSGDDRLWVLNELANRDKHRLLLTVGHSYDEIILDLGRAFGAGQRTRIPHRIQMRKIALQEGAVLAVATRSDEMYEVYKYPEFSFSVAIDETEVVERQPLVPFLKQLTDFVDNTIGLFEPYLR